MDLELPHGCSPEDAQHCIDTWLRELNQEHGQRIESASVTWKDAIASFQLGLRTPLGRIQVPGQLTVDASRFLLHGDLPLRVRIFSRKVESTIRDALTAKCKKCPKNSGG